MTRSLNYPVNLRIFATLAATPGCNFHRLELWGVRLQPETTIKLLIIPRSWTFDHQRIPHLPTHRSARTWDPTLARILEMGLLPFASTFFQIRHSNRHDDESYISKAVETVYLHKQKTNNSSSIPASDVRS